MGEIQQIHIGHENLGTVNDWYLENVKIQTTNQELASVERDYLIFNDFFCQFRFTANRWLSPTKELFAELLSKSTEDSTYFITIKTLESEQVDDIQMDIHGSDGDIEKISLKNFINLNEKGSLDQFEIKHKDIGNVRIDFFKNFILVLL